MSKPLVRFIIADTHMGLGHEGLEEVISLHKKQSPVDPNGEQLIRRLKKAGIVLE